MDEKGVSQSKKIEPFAIVSICLFVLSIILMIIILNLKILAQNFLLLILMCIPIISIVYGSISLTRIKKNQSKGKTISVISIILSIILIITIIYIIIPKERIGPSLALNEPEPVTADPSNPITFSSNSVIVGTGSDFALKVEVFNTFPDLKNFTLNVTCNPNNLLVNTHIRRTTNTPPNTSMLILESQISKKTPKDTYLCTIDALGFADPSNLEYQKNFTVVVQ